MINIAQLKNQLYDIIYPLSSVPFIWGEQEGVPPATEFIVGKIKNWRQIGSNASEYASGNNFTTYTLNRFTLQLISVGADSNQFLLEIDHRIQKDSVRYQFQAAGFSLLNKGEISPAPKLLSTGWEQRYALDVNFNIVISDTDNLGYVEFVEITTIVKDANDNTLIEDTQTIDIVP